MTLMGGRFSCRLSQAPPPARLSQPLHSPFLVLVSEASSLRALSWLTRFWRSLCPVPLSSYSRFFHRDLGAGASDSPGPLGWPGVRASQVQPRPGGGACGLMRSQAGMWPALEEVLGCWAKGTVSGLTRSSM